jgi:hypothetical protein
MCGMGRTGTLHACEQEGISPDLMAIAKGLGGGYAPIAALLIAEEIFNTLAEGSGTFLHNHTYMGHHSVDGRRGNRVRILRGAGSGATEIRHHRDRRCHWRVLRRGRL